MKSGITFAEFNDQVAINAAHREDVVARLNICRFHTPADGHSVFTVDGLGEYRPTLVFHRQLAETLRIPMSYYASMLADYPALLDANVNAWMASESNDTYRMLRLFDSGHRDAGGKGIARAMRSSSFMPLDDMELFSALRPVLDESGITVQSCHMSDRQTILKITTDRLKGDVKVGDTVQGGLLVSNSEVGHGNITVAPFIHRLVCLNGMCSMVKDDSGVKRIHRGTAWPTSGPFEKIYDGVDRKAATAHVWEKVSEAISVTLQSSTFDGLLQRFRQAHKATVRGDAGKLMATLSKRYALTDAEQAAALENFETESKDRTIWGVSNAITRIANTAEHYSRASYLERIGGEIIQLSPAEWSRLAEKN